MQKSSDIRCINFLIGNTDILNHMSAVPARRPFDKHIINFLGDLSKILMSMPGVRQYPDVVTLGFWLRKASIAKLQERFCYEKDELRFGRGVVFHIAPSNVPVNFAYSLAVGLLTGNANVVRVPSRDYTQIKMITEAIMSALEKNTDIKPYICLVRYERNNSVNDYLSSLCDTRVVWGGDDTIAELRKSPLPPRSTEITFADRYSLAVIDSDWYMGIENKKQTAEEFYNDTYLSDQNACTSPRIVVWTGKRIEEAKQIFWNTLHNLVKKKYDFRPIQAVNKLTSAYLLASTVEGISLIPMDDNLIVRVKIPKADAGLMDLKDNSGYFFEYDCENIFEIKAFCNDKRCQTLAYIGKKEMFIPLFTSGIKGVDRVVPVGRTMDFDLIWDGYNLVTQLTREVVIL